jgi:hypothetical protein
MADHNRVWSLGELGEALCGVLTLSPAEDGAEDIGRTCGEERRGASSWVVCVF